LNNCRKDDKPLRADSGGLVFVKSQWPRIHHTPQGDIEQIPPGDGEKTVKEKINKTVLLLTILFLLTGGTGQVFGGELIPENLFNIGDSIGEGEAADGVIGSHHHDKIWSTGYGVTDQVISFNERFASSCPSEFEVNSSLKDSVFNHAVTGADIMDFPTQAIGVVAAADSTTAGKAGMIAVYLGNNDACANSLEDMTSAADFEYYYRIGLDILTNAPQTRDAHIHITAIPAIYWLWEALRNDEWCLFTWQFVPCDNLLANPLNDCGSGSSHLDPDTVHGDDGPNCVRRKQFHAMIRDVYNPILRDVLQEYIADSRLPNAYFNDIFGVRFQAEHINKGDCFHPSILGQAYLAEQQWATSPWANGLQCTQKQQTFLPWLLLLMD
jgi:GDSL-like Lipase/Acylhydrolase